MLRSPLRGWLGGKYRLAKTITQMIPTDHTCYCEPFAGAAWVLFCKAPSRAEVLGDINGDITNLYRVLQNHLEEFVRYFRWALVSREEFQRLRELPGPNLTDVQRAARFYYIQKLCFGGRIVNPTFGASTTGHPKLNLLRIEEDLSAAHLRLANVVIENLPYAELITRYDRQGTVFYIDPPYWGCENYYGRGIFGREDFAALAALLGGLKGRFVLSLNDTPGVREVFGAFEHNAVETMYSVGENNTRKVRELLITNFKPA